MEKKQNFVVSQCGGSPVSHLLDGGHPRSNPIGYQPPTAAPTAPATCTAAIHSATTRSGVSCAARLDGEPIHIILDNLSANKTAAIRRWAQRTNVELCYTPTNASWANPIEDQSATHVHHGQLQPSQPHRPGPQTPGIPTLAQHQRPPPRHSRRATSRTRPRPLRTSTTLGTPPTPSRLGRCLRII